MNKVEILAFLDKNPGWVLQCCIGTRDNFWWWLREHSDHGSTIDLNGNSARAASKELTLDTSDTDWRHSTYRYVEEE